MKQHLGRARFLVAFFVLAAAPASAQKPPAKPAGTTTDTKAAEKPLTPALKARHEVCLAFIRRHGFTCDPWVQPTCGHDADAARPMECVAP